MTGHDLARDQTPITAILEKQRSAFLREGAPGLAQRQADLIKLKNALLARRRAFEVAAHADFGHRSAYETTILDIIPVIQGINYLRRNLRKWMRPERRHVAMHFLPGSARVVYQPLGVIGIMAPWNYPVSLLLIPLATAIAAGNRAMVKPSEFTPATTEAMTVMLREIFPEDRVTVVTGEAEIGAAFSALPFDHLVFTGSTNVGRSVMKAASENLVPVTLELGGKSPVIVEHGYSLDRATRDIAFGKLANAGQTCIAPDYALVHEDDIESFLAAYINAVNKLYPGGATHPNYTSIINAHHHSRLLALLDDARTKGARVIEINSQDGQVSERLRTLIPTVVLNVTDDMTVMQNEIFGPILPVVRYRAIDDAIAYVNARPRPLALYFFGPEGTNRQMVLKNTTSGNVTINDTLLHYIQDDLPFGGVGASGMGAYHGVQGFRALSHAKGIFEQAKWNSSGMVRSPFSWMTDLVMAYLLR
jgi:coniferyl-aldehyde dehydrogenase